MGDFLEGLPLPTIPFFREILQGLHEEVEEHESHIATYYLSRTSKLPRGVLGGGVDGVICLYSSTIERELDAVSLDVPVVRLGGATPNWHLRPDDCEGVYHATRHLLELGHREVAFLGDLKQQFQIFAHEERFRGYRRALQEASIGLNEDLLFNIEEPSQQAGFEAMKRALESRSSFTAAVCLNDLAALGAVEAAREHGLSVPEELSVTGFDGLAWDAAPEVPLTSIYFDRHLMGRMAVRRIYGEQRHREDWRELLPIELQINGSTAAPATALLHR
jgi:LacI family transcriptional regulator